MRSSYTQGVHGARRRQKENEQPEKEKPAKCFLKNWTAGLYENLILDPKN